MVGQGACPPHRETDRAPSPLAAPVFSHRIRRGLGRLEGRLLQAKPIVFGDENLEVVTFLERFSEGANLWWVEVTGFRHQVLIAVA